MARVTGLEPATSGVTGRHSNQLSYTRALDEHVSAVFVVGAVDKGFATGCQAHLDSITANRRRFFDRRHFARENRYAAKLALVHLALRSQSRPLKGPPRSGRLAQLVERFVYTEDVGGSSPSSPTILFQSRISARLDHQVGEFAAAWLQNSNSAGQPR